MSNNSNIFKLVLTGIFGFCILLGLIAFSSYKSSPSSTSSNVNITIWGTVDKIVMDDYIGKYKQDKLVEFNLTYTYKSLDTIDSALVEAIATGKAPDAILIPHTLERRYLDKAYMITSIPVRTFTDTFVQEAELYIQPDGSIFGLPFFIDPLVMYWNKDMFSSAGIATPPTKWTEFQLLASKISKSDNDANIAKSVVSFGEFQNIDNAKEILSALIMQAGSPIVSYDGNYLVSKLDYQAPTDIMVPAESALQFFTDYSNPKKTVYSWNRSLPSSRQFFLSDDLATYFGFASEYQDIKEKNPNLNFDIAVIPQIVDAKAKITYGELYGFSILKNSPNITPTFSLLSLLVGADSVSTLVNYIDVAPARRDLISAGSPDPIKTVFFNSAIISKGWLDPDAKKTNQIFKDMIENVTTGKMDASGAVTKASTEIDNLLQ
jgi:ABC-type glycerol-3-phosphate transport system substrate-binding protein